VEKASKKYRIAFITGLITDPFYVSMEKGVKAEADKLGIELNYNGSAQWDPSVQTPLLSAVLATKPDFLAVVPVDAGAMASPIKAFDDANIPVATVDTDLTDASLRMLNFTSDNVKGGAAAADSVAKAIGEKGKVALMCYKPGNSVANMRQKGFETEIKKYPNIDYVGAQLMSVSNDISTFLPPVLRANPDLSAVAMCDGNSTGLATSIIGSSGLTGKVKVVGFDFTPTLLSQLKGGQVTSLEVQQPALMGAEALDWAVQYLDGKNPPKKDVVLPFVTVTADNLNDPAVQAVISNY
jgi:ribose transport system substrate-binding protein